MRVVAVIPARYASQRLPAKPLADICGKPMVQRVYERAAQARRVDELLVATDDARIEAAVRSFGGNAMVTPASLQSGTDRIAFAAKELDADIVVNVQGDEPLIEPAMIDEAVAVVADTDALVGTIVKRIESQAELFNPNIVKVALGANGRCLYFSRSPIPYGRDLPHEEWLRHHTFYKHFGIYVFRREMLLRFPKMDPTPLERAEKLEQLRILEHGIAITAAVTAYDCIPVDTAEDLERVRTICAREHERH